MNMVKVVDGGSKGEFRILEEKNDGGAAGSGGNKLTSCSVFA